MIDWLLRKVTSWVVSPAVVAPQLLLREQGEPITDLTETERVMREMQAFNKQVNAAYVDPMYIVSVRKTSARSA